MNWMKRPALDRRDVGSVAAAVALVAFLAYVFHQQGTPQPIAAAAQERADSAVTLVTIASPPASVAPPATTTAAVDMSTSTPVPPTASPTPVATASPTALPTATAQPTATARAIAAIRPAAPPTATSGPPTATPRPAPTATAAPFAAYTGTYVVRVGDTLGQVALQYGISVDDLARANGIGDPNFILVGQTLKVPAR